ncbi:MAG: DUF262 domain-containing protein [Candidatus Mucispirillum faecigallinarum]|nr:DUF262 domain-containing protein [Candidatus Mucispirillum faecigallinarum]
MSEDIELININSIFKDEYIIPIYQRKYAWENKEIEQLLEDIINAKEKYYLGTLITNKQESGKYEVIDGQQRLTTLYLLMLNLGKNEKPIQFEARKNYDKALKSLRDNNIECNAVELKNGYECIERYLHNIKHNLNEKLSEVYILRVQVPKNTDLNNYFEVMNTRGEQLELHHIAKARMISKLTNDSDKKIAAAIWDACADMDSYMIVNLKKSIRDNIFENDLSNFINEFKKIPENIKDTWEALSNKFKEIDSVINETSINEIINGNENYDENSKQNKNEDDIPDYKLSSIISFPYFLLYVNAVLLDKNEEQTNLYDDRKLLDNLKGYYKSEDSEYKVKKFIYTMMQCRFLFDKYIIKRDTQDSDETKVILRKYKKYKSGIQLINTFSNKNGADDENDDENDAAQDSLIILESTLRITYTSPRNMHWITELLKYVMKNEEITVGNLIKLLENYCVNKIKDINFESDKLHYGNIERIVFTYLDYLLYRDGYAINGKEIIKKEGDYKVYFRNSVEHFYPRHPDSDNKWSNDELNSFGNLALITPSANSKFSNLDPKAKIVNIKNIEQSPKLKIMAAYIKNGENWTPDMAKEHEKEMCKILENEKNRKNNLI